jgi:DNA-binding GntR family transcriptional regulator
MISSASVLEFQAAGPRSLAEKAYQLLVRKIIRLEYPPGSVLAEKHLMDDLGIGRTPIREALQRLAIERLVDHLPNRGMLVSDISATSVQQIYEFRALVDGYAAWLAAQRATAQQIEELGTLHRYLVRATEDDDIDQYVGLDRRFYSVLSAAAHNILIAEAVPRIFNLHLRLWFFISTKIGGWHTIARSHEEMTKGIVDALARRDAQAARRAMETYIEGRHRDVKDVL